ncbi:MAG: TetR/AcrR family transcriptional regulator [Rhodothermales bacterium]
MPDPRTGGTDLRRAILDQTRHLLVEEGYHTLSMRKIARAVGCSATSIYLHFENKDALFHGLIDEGFARLNEAFQHVADAHADAVERLETLSRRYVEFGLDNPEYYEIMFMLHPERMSRYPAEKYRRARRNLEVFTETLREGADAGQLDVEDAAVAASVLWAALHGAVGLLLARRVDVRIERDVFVEAVVRHAIVGFRFHAGALPHVDG